MIYLSATRHPFVQIDIRFANSLKTIDCMIDTGFSAGIALPEKYFPLIDQQSKWKQSFELADGSLVTFDLHKLVVRYGKTTKTLSALFTKGNDALVGIEFLQGFRFLLDLRDNTVELS